MKTKFKIAMLTVSLLSISSMSAICQEYIVMGTPLVNIRTGTGTDSYIIARASKGDVFKVVRKQSGWYEIEMFTGERRYVVEANFVYPLTIADIQKRPDMDLPSEIRCKSIYNSII
ncbi:MAG: SH3 domain-containing protein, partial [Bacteroidales bacterium]|nr:SH3 domain-containing protein [Bacteroidales bacterium]